MKKNLFDQICRATELPENFIKEELTQLIQAHGKSPESLTVEEMRVIAEDYLREVLVQLKKASNKNQHS